MLRYAGRCFLIVLVAAVCLTLASCADSNPRSELAERLEASSHPFSIGDASEGNPPSTPVELNIVSIGDILMHYPWQQEFDGAGNSMFPEYFQYINDLTRDADLALCNIEAPFAGGEPAGYPLFNMGDTMAPAVRDAGFDVVYTSHNHMLDQHSDAVFRTVQILRDAGLQATGSRLSTDEPNYAFVDVKGVNIAVIAYTYESSPKSINGLPLSADMDPFINSFSADSEADLAEMKEAIDASRASGADLVLFYLHAGTEYSHEPNADQRSVAQFLVDNGVDIILGSHVHVIQPMELLQPSHGDTPVPVYWGMGNYISGQVVEWDMEPANEEGILAELRLVWNPETRAIDALTMEYLPLWNTFYSNGERVVHTVIPERGNIADNPSIQASGYYDRAQSAFAEVHGVMGESISWKRGE
ncbi:MAG: CapA family protein [Coriobacteriales bacterium]|jgi:poly-gamma-glutamate synthesis protein (capsule biosynthesis protein)|nr:CapA family protein [Coriobacteriales bacterium]